MRWQFLYAFLIPAGMSFAQQPLGASYWNSIRSKADSLLDAHFGKEFVVKHIFHPYEPLEYIAYGGRSVDWDHRDTVTQVPLFCYFEYTVGLDSSTAWRTNIQFAITPDGERVPVSIEPTEEWGGFADCGGVCAFKHDLKGFISVAKANGVNCRKRDAFRDLVWIGPDSISWASGMRNGRYELTLGRYLGRGKETIGYSTYSYELFDTIVLDPFTGAILSRGKRKETYMIACGIQTL